MLVDPRRVSSLSTTSGCSDCTTATLQGMYLILREIIYVRVLKLQNFFVNDILREIRVGESGASKINIFIHSEVLNINFYEFLNAEIYQIS